MNASKFSKLRAFWKVALSSMLAPVALVAFSGPADAVGMDDSSASAQELILSQFDFGGMDLSDEPAPSAKTKKSKNKKKKKKSKKSGGKKKSGKKSKRANVSSDDSSEGASMSSASDGSGGMDFGGLDLNSGFGEPEKTAETTAPAAQKASASSSEASAFGGVSAKAEVKAETPPAPPPTNAPVMSFDAVDVTGKSAERQRLDAAIKMFNEKRYETAALALYEVLKDPNMAELHDEAQYTLAKTFYRLKMYHSALNHFKVILDKGDSTKFFKTCLEWLFYIARKTVNEQVVLDEVAKHADADFPERFRSEFRYLLARYHFNRAKAFTQLQMTDDANAAFEEAKKLVLMIPKSDPFYTKTKYLEGVIFFAQGDFAQAVESFKTVVRLNNPKSNPKADLKIREMAFMQLARTHYGHRQNRYAVFYYNKVNSGSPQWLEALFEASWAHYRVGEYEYALGNLITLAAPFFKDEYFPESLILKAVIYYENCRYREARAILDEFEKTYMPVHDELLRITSASTDAAGYWEIFAEVQKRNREGLRGANWILERILSLALTDKDLKASSDIIQEIEKEMDSIRSMKDVFRFSELAKTVNEELKLERRTMMEKAGIMAKAKLEFELSQLKGFLGQALRIKFETSSQEKNFLEEAIASQGTVDVVQKYKHSVAVSDQQVYWPYEGEYWRDELGTYQYTLTKGCRPKGGEKTKKKKGTGR